MNSLSDKFPWTAKLFVLSPWRLIPLTLLLGIVVSLQPVLGLLFLAPCIVFLFLFGKVEIIVYLFLLSSVFFRYRVDLGFATLNPFRVFFLIGVALLPFLPVKRRHLFSKQFIYSAFLGVLLLILFTFGWYRSPDSFRSAATTNFLLLVSWLAFLLYLTYVVDRPERFDKVLKSYLATSTVVAGFGVYQGLMWAITGRVPPLPFSQFVVTQGAPAVLLGGIRLPRIESLFHDANLVAVYLAIAVFLLVAFYVQGRVKHGHHRILFALVLIVHVTCIVLTISRSGALLLIFGLMLFAFKKFELRPAVVVPMVLGLGFVTIVTIYFINPEIFNLTSDYLRAIFVRLASGDHGVRLQYARAGLKLFVDSPLIGVGMGHPSLQSLSRTGIADTTHSLYLTILAHYGIIGAVLLAGLLLPLLREAVLSLIARRPAALDVGFAAATLIILAFQIIYDSLLGEVMLFPFALVYLWAIHRKKFNTEVAT